MKLKAILPLVFCVQLSALGQVGVSFFGLDRAHLSYSGWANHTNSQNLQFIRKNGSQVVVIATSVTASISGTSRQDAITAAGAKFAVRENFIVNGQAQFEDRGEISLVRSNTVGGTMLFSEEIAFSVTDTLTTLGSSGPYGVLQVPEGTTLGLSGIPSGSGFDIRVAGGLTISACTDLWLIQVGVSGTVPFVIENSQLDGLQASGADGATIQVQSCSFAGPVTIATPNLQVSDSLFASYAGFAPSKDSSITGNEFKGSEVVVYTTAATSTFQNNVVASGLRLCVPDATTPTWPAISQNSFVGKIADGGCSVQVCDIYGRPNAYSGVPLSLAGNFWGGLRGPIGNRPFWAAAYWLAAYGPGICSNFTTNETALASGPFRVASVSDKRPFPQVFAVSHCGQGILTWKDNCLNSAYAIQGRDTLVCYDLRTTERSLTAQFYLMCNGKRVEPYGGSSFTIQGNYGPESSSASDANRTLNFIIPASDTETNQLALELWMDARGVTDYSTPGQLVQLDGLAINAIQPHFARKLRIGVMPVAVNLSGFKTNVDGKTAKSVGSVSKVISQLRQGLETRWPLRSKDYDLVQLSTYNYEGGFLGKWWVGLTYIGFMNNLASELSINFLADYNDAVMESEKLDFLVAVLPANSLDGADGANMKGRRQVALVDEWAPDAALHELGHALGLYTGTEEYDLPESTVDVQHSRIVAEKGAVIEGITAFIPDSKVSSDIVPQRIRHFALDNAEGVYDVMGSQNKFWITPATLTDIYNNLQALLGTTNVDVNSMMSPGKVTSYGGTSGAKANYTPPAPGFRRVAFMGIEKMTMLGPPYNPSAYVILPQTFVCRDTTLENWSTHTGTYNTFQSLRMYDSDGNILVNHQIRCRDARYYNASNNYVAPTYVEWYEVIDVPQAAAIYQVFDTVSQRPVFAVTNSNQAISNHLTVAGGAQMGGQISISWTNTGSDVTHTVYYQTNGGNWKAVAGIQGVNRITLPTDFLPVSSSISLKVVTADGFTSREDSLGGYQMTNRAPIAAIQWPPTSATSATNVLWALRGSADDTEDGALTGTWTSSIDGSLGTGNSLQNVVLSPGTHTLTFQAQDSGGLASATNVTVTVAPMSSSDLSIAPDDLNCRQLGSDPMVATTSLIYGGTNVLTVTIANNGISNAILANLYVQAPGQSEYLANSVQITNWAPFDTATLTAQIAPVSQGSYQMRAQITSLGLPDPNPSNNTQTWLLTNCPPIAYGAVLDIPANTNGTFQLRAMDPNGDPISYTITAQPTSGSLVSSGTNWVYTSGSLGGTDSFRYRVSDGLLSSPEATVKINIAGPSAPSTNAVPPVIYSTLQAWNPAAQPFSYQILASNNPTWYGAQGMPTGLSVDHTNGLISGTPTQIGTFNIGLQATNSAGMGTATLVLQLSQNFTNWASSYGLTGAAASPTADPDHDGINNVLEYAFGLNPAISNKTGIPTAWWSNGYGGICYRRLEGGNGMPGWDYFMNGLIYYVEWGNSLEGAWNRGTTFLTGLTTNNGDGTETVVEQAPQVVTNQPLFLRLTVQKIP